MTERNSAVGDVILEVLLEQMEEQVPDTPDLDRRIRAAIDQYCAQGKAGEILTFEPRREDEPANGRLAREYRLLPLAAEPAEGRDPVVFHTIDGEFALRTEEIGADSAGWILQVECLEGSKEVYVGRVVEVRVGKRTFILGPVDRHGFAEVAVPADLDMHQEINIRIRESL